jgi:hypothetical protein
LQEAPPGEARHPGERDQVPAEQQRGGDQQDDRGRQRHVARQVGGEVDPAGDYQGQREHADLGDRWQPALAHPVASLTMITSVATCIAPRIAAVYRKRFIRPRFPETGLCAGRCSPRPRELENALAGMQQQLMLRIPHILGDSKEPDPAKYPRRLQRARSRDADRVLN